MATATDVAVSVAASSVPLGIVWVFDDSYGGDGILAKKEIKTPARSKGKKSPWKWVPPVIFFY